MYVGQGHESVFAGVERALAVADSTPGRRDHTPHRGCYAEDKATGRERKQYILQ